MRSRPARFSLRLAIALAGTMFMSLGVVLLPWAAGSSAAAQATAAASTATPTATATPIATSTASPAGTASPTAAPSATATPSPRPSKKPEPHAPPALSAPRDGAVIRGPQLFDPRTGKLFPFASHVSVSQVSSLVNQVVQVSWSGFTPSTSVTYDPGATLYPVMVAECAGTDPRSSTDCFGADNGGVTGQFSQFGPMNTAYATTARNGSGTTAIELLTAEEDSKLGCKRGHPCSLVMVRLRAETSSPHRSRAMTTRRTSTQPPARTRLRRPTAAARGATVSSSRSSSLRPRAIVPSVHLTSA